jgi:hypothetical protein
MKRVCTREEWVEVFADDGIRSPTPEDVLAVCPWADAEFLAGAANSVFGAPRLMARDVAEAIGLPNGIRLENNGYTWGDEP